MTDKQLTPHFKLSEFTRSATAESRGIDNTPDSEHLTNLINLANTLEAVRALFGGAPVVITSGYRSPALNKAVGGVATSDHANGLAADFTVKGYTVQQAAEKIAASGIRFDQLIFEQGSTEWVHLGIGSRMRGEVLSWKKGVGYVPGIRNL